MNMRCAKTVGLLLALGLLVAACGSDDGDSADGGEADSEEVRSIEVTADEFLFDTSVTTFETGVPYRFVVENVGEVNHEFMIMEPVSDSTMSMEELDELAVTMIEADELTPGNTRSVEVTFEQAYPEGTLEFACHQPGHYEGGMRLPIEVE